MDFILPFDEIIIIQSPVADINEICGGANALKFRLDKIHSHILNK